MKIREHVGMLATKYAEFPICSKKYEKYFPQHLILKLCILLSLYSFRAISPQQTQCETILYQNFQAHFDENADNLGTTPDQKNHKFLTSDNMHF